MPRLPLTVARVGLAITLVGITVLSLAPGVQTGAEGADKFWHLAAYLVLSFLLVLSVRRPPTRIARIVTLVIVAAGYGLIMEIIQRYVGRQFDLGDLAANAAGAVIGTIGGAAVRRWVTRRDRAWYDGASRDGGTYEDTTTRP